MERKPDRQLGVQVFLLAVLLFSTRAPLPAGETRFFRISAPVPTTITAVTPKGTVTWVNSPTNSTFTIQTAVTLAGPSPWADWVDVPVSNAVTVHWLFDPDPPPGMVLIPAGSFTMGNGMATNEGASDELPLHTVEVSGFYLDRCEVTQALWDEVATWAGTNGYDLDGIGSGKATNHPVHTVSWYDAVKWCNARSEKEGRAPAYHTSSRQNAVYRTGELDLLNDWVQWNATGYRLPTEAEWEKAARAGAHGHRFPWIDTNTIDHSRANYYAAQAGITYDGSYPAGYPPAFATGGYPYTSPVASFPPNGYGLYDMAGNLEEWCWDWDDVYGGGPQTDPHGPVEGWDRVARGGSWYNGAVYCRTAHRLKSQPGTRSSVMGFRCARPAGP